MDMSHAAGLAWLRQRRLQQLLWVLVAVFGLLIVMNLVFGRYRSAGLEMVIVLSLALAMHWNQRARTMHAVGLTVATLLLGLCVLMVNNQGLYDEAPMAFPALLLFIFVAVRRGLQPLESMASEVSTRTFDNLAPVASSKVPREALPLAEAIDRLLARLAAARDNERRFTADAAHELRTPLAAIRVQAQVARMAPESEARERALSNVIAGLDRATRLVEQLLRLARLDPLARLPQTETVELGGLLEGVFVELRDHYPQAELSLEISGSDSIPGDADLLRVALRNLVDNAVRYADGAAVALFVRRDPEGDALLLGVSDDGPGVADNELTRLRERFYRSPTVQPLSGSGLGLAIVERIAELHGATLRLINRPEGGFEAALRWPSEGR